jgi:hypothetical protein
VRWRLREVISPDFHGRSLPQSFERGQRTRKFEGRRGLSRPDLQIFRNPPWPLGAFAIGQGAASGVGLEGSGPS